MEGDSGAGSDGRLAEFKADVLNEFVRRHGIRSVIELGCGDGRQLALTEYPEYIGVDVSPEALQRCHDQFGADRSKRFVLLEDLEPSDQAELALSLDVIYHLVEDEVFEGHMRTLDRVGTRFIILYTSEGSQPHAPQPHVRHRPIREDVAKYLPHWRLVDHIPNPYPWDPNDVATSFADFFVYSK